MNEAGHHHQQLQLAERVAYLIAGHLQGNLTAAEEEELDNWITESDANLELFEKLTDEESIDTAMEQFWAIEKDKQGALLVLKQRLKQKKRGTLRIIWPYLVAASLIGLVLTFYLVGEKKEVDEQTQLAQRTTTPDRKHGSNKAVLMLSDGRTIILDSATGNLAKEGTISINRTKTGEIIYNGTTAEMRYNTVSTPRGAQFKLVLGDGTEVWLNAESSIKFPAGFASTDREVELRGEAFFKVAENKKLFRVKVLTATGEDGMVEVLGTQFNVNGYSDEGAIKTTLLEGSVRVENGGQVKIISPGQQAIMNRGIQVVKADLAEETAWKEGKFLFRDATMPSIAAQLERWYDLQVEYRGNITQHFNMEAERAIPLARLLQLLQNTGQVNFQLEGNKLVIQP